MILARQIGLRLEEDEIGVESLVPPGCESADSVEEFFTTLKQFDGEFKDRQQSALSENKVLRYIASIEDGKAAVSLQAVGMDHPFYSLSGSDNIISVTTSRYLDRPLVVKGPGAGTAVTAAGIFADIFKAATYLR
jgi:aspartokinase/homoserine dehydrogenase 1